jgi:RNA polymerase sporulation-specific sigma factor
MKAELYTMTNYCDFDNMLDEEIVLISRDDNPMAEEYLIHKYRNYVKAKAKSYFLIGADKRA